MEQDISPTLQDRVAAAFQDVTPLSISAGNSKSFLGRLTQAEPLSVKNHHGIVTYEPTELVIRARAGTRISELEAALAEKGQMLPFEPPRIDPNTTIGGTIACGLSGPRRPYAGAARDFVLGAKVITGRGEILNFGGQVMKNVAGYDVSRLMTGSMGTLGVILDISMKVLPRPPRSTTRVFEVEVQQAIERMNHWAGRPLPLSGACYSGGRLYVRLCGTDRGVDAAATRIGGTPLEGQNFWDELRDQRVDFFQGTRPIWRLSLAPATPPLPLPGESLIEWGGSQRWLKTELPASDIRAVAQAHGGHATLFRNGDRLGDVFHPLIGPLATLHRRVKDAFDPKRILNPGRLYADF